MNFPMSCAAAAIPAPVNAARAAPSRATRAKQEATEEARIRPLRIAGAGSSPARRLDAEA